MTGKMNKAPSPEIRQKVGALLESDFNSDLVRFLRANGYEYVSGDTRLRLAAEFGFCYGVDRAVEYAFAARQRFPKRRIWLTGEIIHNPRVNARLLDMDIDFLPQTEDRAERYGALSPDDVILIPAFGADAGEMRYFLDEGYEIVDTTCGSVLIVWKRVRLYSQKCFTSIIHGKYDHEETLATCSQVISANPDGRYLVILDMDQAMELARQIETGDYGRFGELYPPKVCSPGFEPGRDLGRIGLANQTTMLESESKAIQEILREAMRKRHGEESLADHFLAFDTICSATEDRQQAVRDLLAGGVDRMIVIGGYNSSNTGHLLEISQEMVPSYHIESATCLLDAGKIQAKPLGQEPGIHEGWMPPGPQVIGITGGASTPDSVVGQVIQRILELRGAVFPALEEIRAAREIS